MPRKTGSLILVPPLRTVIVGFGRVAAGLGSDRAMAKWFPKASHLQCIQDNPRFELVGVADRSPEARARARDALPELAVVDEPAALASLHPDIAVLAIPPAFRLDAIRALPGVRGIVLEKPLGEMQERTPFANECTQRNVAVQVHYWRRGDPTMRALRDGELDRRIGSPQAAFALYGNGLRNNGSHIVNLIAMLLGSVTSVRATTPFLRNPHLPLPGDGQAGFAVELASGVQVVVQALDFSHYREIALDIWGTSGRLTITQEGLFIAACPRVPNRGLDDEREIASDCPERLPVTVAHATPSLYQNLADAIENKAELMSPLSEAQETETVLDAVIASAESNGCRVAVGL